MQCAACGGKDFSLVHISAYGYLRKTDEAVLVQIGQAKVPSSKPHEEWQQPPPEVITLACNHCGYVMTFVELNSKIRDRILDALRKSDDG